MKEIHCDLIRKYKYGYGVLGVFTFTIDGKPVKYYTLENDKYIIPDGNYSITYTYSPRFGRKMPLISPVPGRSGIRIHAANYPWQLRGCIALGKPLNIKESAILTRSLEHCNAFHYLCNFFKDVSVDVSITTQYSSKE